jgi:hypothetical protein
MARLLTAGWETGDLGELAGTTTTSTGTVTVVGATPTPASGSWCQKCALTGTAGTLHAVRSYSLGATKTDVWLRFRLYTNLVAPDASLVTSHRLLRLLDSAGALAAGVVLDASTGILRAYRGGGALGANSVTGTLLGSASVPVSGATWTLVEIHYVPTTTATGTVEIWLNNTQVLNATAVQTSSALANVASFTLGIERNTSSGGSASTYVAFDDLGANDTAGPLNNGRCGDNRIAWLPVDGAGALSQWTSSSGGGNATNVDDATPLSGGTADYNAAATAALVDDYTLAALPAGASAVAVVEALCYAINPDGGTSQIKVGVISGASTGAGATQSPGASFAYVRERFETDPNTSAAWTPTAVNALKARIESV